MAYSGLAGFVKELEKKNELRRIMTFADPELEIAEISDRITKNSGAALLFENTGTDLPLLINAYGSDSRMSMVLGGTDPQEAGQKVERLLQKLTGNRNTVLKKVSALPSLLELAGMMPVRGRGRGICQQMIFRDPDLSMLPVLKCWPYDGGRFITLPVVHTRHPETGKTNAGMYRMQVLDRNTTAMHWQRHKTGAAHFGAWKIKGERMPVSVVLGGDPVYAYSATAPLPDGIDEYILAGFLRGKRVKMVKCITNDLYVPSDADIVIEGYVDPLEEPVCEGPFGDHTGFYSLADWYPRFHVTCITRSRKAIYPATIVGIPPNEDAWLTKTTERLFLPPMKLTLQPEIEDFHLPAAGVAHNLVIIRIRKTYPGQGMKVLSSLFGAGQMMFSKYMVVVSGGTDIRNYRQLACDVFKNTDPGKDLLFCRGPLDVLDHSSDSFSFGGKLGIDATIKSPEENSAPGYINLPVPGPPEKDKTDFLNSGLIFSYNTEPFKESVPVAVVTVNRSLDPDIVEKVASLFRDNDKEGIFRLILVVDSTVDPFNFPMVAWQILGNSDPVRDHRYITGSSLLIDGTIKAFRKGGFSRRWPNVVCSGVETITAVDKKWDSLELGPLIKSPSVIYSKLAIKGRDEIETD